MSYRDAFASQRLLKFHIALRSPTYGAQPGGATHHHPYGGPPPPGAGYGQGPLPPPPLPPRRSSPGGSVVGTPSEPPPGTDPQLWNWFSVVDADRSGAITTTELQHALVNGDWSPFDFDTVKLLMTIFDTDHDGTIGFNEFAGLWKYIKDWQGVFRHFDADHSGSIDGDELANALRQFGYNLSPTLLLLLEQKYDIKASSPLVHGAPGPPPGITFDRFLRACVVVKTLTESFQRLDTDQDGWIKIDYETFMQTVLSAP